MGAAAVRTATLVMARRGLTKLVVSLGLLLALIVATQSIIRGYTEVVERMASVGDRPCHVYVWSSSGVFSLSLLDEILLAGNHVRVCPYLVVEANVTSARGATRARVVGVDLDLFDEYYRAKLALSNDTCALGVVLARILGVSKGDYVVVDVNGKRLNLSISQVLQDPRGFDYELLVSLDVLWEELDGLQGLVNSADVACLPSELKDVVEAAEGAGLRAEVYGDRGLTVIELSEQVLGLMLRLLPIVALTSLVASAVITTRVVSEARRDLALLRALGLNRRGLLLAVLAFTALGGLLGSALGVAVGVAVAHASSKTVVILLGAPYARPSLDITSSYVYVALVAASSVTGGLIAAPLALAEEWVEEL